MSTIRLNKAARERILLNVMRHRFAKDFEALSSRVSEFAQRIHWAGVPKGFEAIAKAQPRWFDARWYVDVEPSDGSRRRRLHFRGVSRSSSFDAPTVGEAQVCLITDMARLPYALTDNGTRLLSDADTAILNALLDEHEGLSALFNEAGVQAKALLDSAASLKTLLERWPEVKPFTSFMATTSPSKGALVVPTAGLNNLLGLPVEDAA